MYKERLCIGIAYLFVFRILNSRFLQVGMQGRLISDYRIDTGLELCCKLKYSLYAHYSPSGSDRSRPSLQNKLEYYMLTTVHPDPVQVLQWLPSSRSLARPNFKHSARVRVRAPQR